MEVDALQQVKLDKLQKIKDLGIEPYAYKFDGVMPSADILNNFQEEKDVILAGRIMANRKHGKVMFVDLQDQSGRIQLFVRENTIGAEAFELAKNLDLGDIIGVKGKTFITRVGEQSIRVESLTILAKSLATLPEKFHGLKDVDLRYRQRYVDLIVSQGVRDVFIKRSRITSLIRRYLDDKGFLEVETPMLQTMAGGARGRPFKSSHNAYDLDVFLRIAPELYLKRLLVGGLERVYELNRNFRNEGVSTRHNPEFTMLEVYQAYTDYEGMMALTEEMISGIVKEVTGSYKVNYQGREIDFTTPWERRSFAQVVKDKFDINPEDDATVMLQKVKAVRGDVKVDTLTKTAVMNIVEETLEEDEIVNPIFFTDYFTFLCPLAKNYPDNPHVSQRFEIFAAGMEIGNAYSELNDPQEQKERLLADLGEDLETGNRAVDEDFLNALEYGMPPAGGLGIGIDRLVMLLTNSASIRDVILFPLMKPVADQVDESAENEEGSSF